MNLTWTRGRALLLVLVGALLALTVGCQAPAQSGPGNAAGGTQAAGPGDTSPVVTLNGEVVTRSQYEDELYNRFAEDYLERFIETRLIAARAESMGVKIDEAQVNEEVQRNVDTLLKTRFGGEENTMRQALQERGMSLEGWKKDLAEKARREQLLDAMIKKNRDAGSDAVKKRFEQTYGEDGVKYRVRHILISTKVINTRFYPKEEFEAEKDKIEAELKTLGGEIQRQLAQGGDFAKLAREHSDDYTANRGGDLGEAWKGRFGNAFDDAVTSLSVNQTSGLIRAKRGYHIIQVTGINPGVEYQGAAILASTGPSGPGDARTQEQRDADAQEKVKKIQEALGAGKDFGEVARELSDDVATRSRGGDLGIFGRRRLGDEVDDVLDKATPGAVTEAIKTPRGFWIIKLDARKAVPDKDRREVRHIFLSAEYDDVKERRLEGKLTELARARADELKARLDKGEDFKALAIEFTEDAYTRKAGGEYYNYRRTSLGPEVWKAVQAMNPATETRIVESNRGFHIVQVMEKEVTKFEEVQETLLKELNDQPVTPADTRAFLEKLKAEAAIERHIGTAPPPPAPAPVEQEAIDSDSPSVDVEPK